jgi:hypothetical protein
MRSANWIAFCKEHQHKWMRSPTGLISCPVTSELKKKLKKIQSLLVCHIMLRDMTVKPKSSIANQELQIKNS